MTENKIDELRKKKSKNRKLVKLKTIADVKGGRRLPEGTVVVKGEANDIPYVRAADIKNRKVNLDTTIRIPKQIHQKIQNHQLQNDDLVITIVGALIGEIGILEEYVEVCDFTENVAKVRVNEDSILPRFILHFLDSEYGKMQTEKFTVGSLQFKLSLRSCRNIEIYVPCVEDGFDTKAQQGILDEASKLFARAEQQRKKGFELIHRANSEVVEKLKIPIPDEEIGVISLREIDAEPVARLDALYNNPFRDILIANLKKHPHETLGNLTKQQIKRGISPTDFYRLVEMEQIDEKTGRILYSQEVPELGSQKILLKANSILVGKLQPEKGKVALVPNEFDGAVGSSELVPLQLESTNVSLKYLWAVLRSDYVLKQWEYALTGSSRMRIGSTELTQTIIPIPDRNTQNEITENIDAMLAESDAMLRGASDLINEAKQCFVSTVVK